MATFALALIGGGLGGVGWYLNTNARALSVTVDGNTRNITSVLNELADLKSGLRPLGGASGLESALGQATKERDRSLDQLKVLRSEVESLKVQWNSVSIDARTAVRDADRIAKLEAAVVDLEKRCDALYKAITAMR